MKKSIITIVAFAIMTLSGAAYADTWECTAGSSNSGDSACYVENVRYYTGSNPYVRAKIYDPNEETTCTYIRYQLNSGADSLDAIRGIESMLLTALTTGMPIKFYRRTAYGSDTDCYGATLFVSKPGH